MTQLTEEHFHLIDSNKENSTEEKLQEPEAQESTDIIEAYEVLNETPEPAEVPMDTLQTSTPEAAPADTTGSWSKNP